MNNNERMANYYYGIMMSNYVRWQRDVVGSHAAKGRFINAAIALAKLNMPNPFSSEKTEDNAQARPEQPGRVTGVIG